MPHLKTISCAIHKIINTTKNTIAEYFCSSFDCILYQTGLFSLIMLVMVFTKLSLVWNKATSMEHPVRLEFTT